MAQELEVGRIAGIDTRLLIDCGAVTKMVTPNPEIREKITLDNYCAMIEKHKPQHYMSFDEIGDQEQTDRNLHEMLERGFSPIPIFTCGARESSLRKLTERFEYIAIGNLGRLPRGTKHDYIKRIQRRFPDTRIHWLGCSDRKSMRERMYSSDSTSWMEPILSGSMTHHRRDGSRFLCKNGQFKKMQTMPIDVEEDFRRWGLYELLWLKRWTMKQAGEIGSSTWLRYGAANEARGGPKLYLVITTLWQMRALQRGYEILKRAKDID